MCVIVDEIVSPGLPASAGRQERTALTRGALIGRSAAGAGFAGALGGERYRHRGYVAPVASRVPARYSHAARVVIDSAMRRDRIRDADSARQARRLIAGLGFDPLPWQVNIVQSILNGRKAAAHD